MASLWFFVQGAFCSYSPLTSLPISDSSQSRRCRCLCLVQRKGLWSALAARESPQSSKNKVTQTRLRSVCVGLTRKRIDRDSKGTEMTPQWLTMSLRVTLSQCGVTPWSTPEGHLWVISLSVGVSGVSSCQCRSQAKVLSIDKGGRKTYWKAKPREDALLETMLESLWNLFLRWSPEGNSGNF